MNNQEALELIIYNFDRYPEVEGAFLAGSFATGENDKYSDIDICIVTQTKSSFLDFYSKRLSYIKDLGESVISYEKEWENVKLISVIYSAEIYKPLGLVVDFIYGYLDKIAEMMPWVKHKIVYDRNGEISKRLPTNPDEYAKSEIIHRILKDMQDLPLKYYSAAKTIHRKDKFDARGQLTAILNILYFINSVVCKQQLMGSRRSTFQFNDYEIEIIDNAFNNISIESLNKVVDLIFDRYRKLINIGYKGIEKEVKDIHVIMRKLTYK
jgi:predicted nucleotidyltransferase